MLLRIVSGLTLLALGYVARDAWRLTRVPHLADDARPDPQPAVSLLIPARNEERRIGRCLDGALAQSYTNYEVVVVDDGSSDGTATILTAYAEGSNRLRVLTGRALPPGWAGKPHACQQAAEAATAEWLLFLDADTAPQPTLVAALVAFAQQQQLDMLSIFPLLELGTFAERLILPPFLGMIMASFPLDQLSNPEGLPERALANGQCLLVRREAYCAIGGHRAVQAEVLEDVRLAQALRRSGYRVGFATGMRHLRVRMYTSLNEVVEGLTKNAVAGARAAGNNALWAGIQLNLLAMMPLWFVALASFLHHSGHLRASRVVLAHAAIVGGVTSAFWAMLAQRVYRQPAVYGLLWPVGLFCYDLIALRAAVSIWSGRGIVWKGRFYAE